MISFHLNIFQSANAPMETSSSHLDLSGSWLGLRELLKIIESKYIESDGLPAVNDFLNEDYTLFRNVLLVSLSSIRTRSLKGAYGGYTPTEVIDILLLFAENNDNGVIINDTSLCEDEANSNEKLSNDIRDQYVRNPASKSTKEAITYDDSHYCALLLYCLSRIKFDNSSNNSNNNSNANSNNSSNTNWISIARRIKQLALKFLVRDKTMAISEQRFMLLENISLAEYSCHVDNNILYNRSMSMLSAGGIVTIAALQCLCALDLQTGGSFPSASIEYDSYVHNNWWPYAVRIAALDCCVRLNFARYLYLLRTSAGGDVLRIPIANAVGLVCDVIEKDPVKEVQSAVIILLIE